MVFWGTSRQSNPTPGAHSTLPTLGSVPAGSAREGEEGSGLPLWGRCHPAPVQAGLHLLVPVPISPGPRWRRCGGPSAVPAPVSQQARRCARGHGVTAQPWGWQGCGDASRGVPLGQSGRERSEWAPQPGTPHLPTPGPPNPPGSPPTLPRQLKSLCGADPPRRTGRLCPPTFLGKGGHWHKRQVQLAPLPWGCCCWYPHGTAGCGLGVGCSWHEMSLPGLRPDRHKATSTLWHLPSALSGAWSREGGGTPGAGGG